MLLQIFVLLLSILSSPPALEGDSSEFYRYKAEDLTSENSFHRSRLTVDTSQLSFVEIDRIVIIGNKKTKEEIILREMDVAPGEVYYKEDLKEILVKDRSKIFNTRLFNTVNVSLLDLHENKVEIIVTVTERWYTFPVPIFKLVDRNFNDWWQNQNHDFSRTNYGIRLYQNNVNGRNETLRALIQLGYTKKFEVAYSIPYIDKTKKHGLSFTASYAENNNIAYQTVAHKQQFIDSKQLLKIARMYNVSYRYRNSFYTSHTLKLTYNNNSVNDTIALLNPEYYGGGERSQKFMAVTYLFTYDHRDVISYPLEGKRLDVIVQKRGIGHHDDLNIFDINARHVQYLSLNHKFFLANYTSLYISTPEEQPYNDLGGLGYDKNFVRGYELYLIEGKHYALNRTSFKKQLLSLNTRVKAIPIEQFRQVPLSIYIKTYFDMGYVKNYDDYTENSLLSNRWLFGTGIGLDIVSYYDSVIRLEYSINREKETGFYLHLKKAF